MYLHRDRIPLTVSYHQFLFLIGQYSVAEFDIWLKNDNDNENDKKTLER